SGLSGIELRPRGIRPLNLDPSSNASLQSACSGLRTIPRVLPRNGAKPVMDYPQAAANLTRPQNTRTPSTVVPCGKAFDFAVKISAVIATSLPENPPLSPAPCAPPSGATCAFGLPDGIYIF